MPSHSGRSVALGPLFIVTGAPASAPVLPGEGATLKNKSNSVA
jgi:hypothetical protein